MIFIEENTDLFNYEGKAWLAHCISSDFKMVEGIAVEFVKRYNIKNFLIKNYFKDNWTGKGYCILVENKMVFNLVTKRKYSDKPTYNTIRQALIDMKNYAISKNIDTIAMPRIGCGLDKLVWENKVEKIIKEVFANTDIKIIICSL